MLPTVPSGRSKVERQIVNFRGLNLGEGWQDGELASSLNLSCRKFPALTQRGRREELSGYSAPSALYSWNGLVAVDGTSLKIDGETVATVTPGEKQFAVVNTKLCVFPDKIYIDLTNNELKPMEASILSLAGATATFTTSSLTIQTPENKGTIVAWVTDTYRNYNYPDKYNYDYIQQYTSVSWDNATKTWTLLGGGKVRPYDSAEVGKFVMLEKTDIASSYILNVQEEEFWSNQPATITDPFAENNDRGIYAKILAIEKSYEREDKTDYTKYVYTTKLTLEIHDASVGNEKLTRLFNAGNLISITGADVAANNVVKKPLLSLTDTTMTFTDGTFTADTQSGQLKITRAFPDLDYICESQNRLWGVSNADNTIYASALGDPTNFYAYDGTSLDSYAVAVGSEGEFTAICKYDRSVLCFKENTLHRVYGDYPAEYSATERPLFGVKEGAAGTLTNIGSVLYYLGRDGVYAFSGNTPTLISGAFGEKRFSRCYAGSDGEILYMSMKDEDGLWGLYSYDTRKGIWLQEDDTFALSFANVDGHLYFVNGFEAYTVDEVTVSEGGDAIIKCDSETSTEKVEWEAEFTPFDEATLGRKIPSKLSFRCELETGSWVSAYISCDGEPYRLLYTSSDADEPTIVIPVAPRRCDSYKVKLVGKGGCVIRAAERTFRVGSDWR